MFFRDIEKRDIVLLFLGGVFLITFGLFLASDETSMVRLSDKNKSQIKDGLSNSSNNDNKKSVNDSNSEDSSNIGGEVIYGDIDSNDLEVSTNSVNSNVMKKDVSDSTTINGNLEQENIEVDDNKYAVKSNDNDLENGDGLVEDNIVSAFSPSENVSITISPSNKTLKVGERFSFDVEIISDSDYAGIVKYQSNNNTVAEIDQNGVVTAKSKGTAIITVQLSSSISTATITVNNSTNETKNQIATKKQENRTTKSQSNKTNTKKNKTTKSNKASTKKSQTEKNNQANNKNGVVNKNKNNSNTNKNIGMNIPNYYQSDYPDVSLMPGTDRTVASSGCGFTSCSMIVSYLTGKRITPREFVGNWSRKYYVYNAGMSWSLPQAAATHYNLGKVEQTSSTSRMIQALKNKQPVMSSQGPGIFTQNSHLIVLRGITSNGKILVNDPNKSNAVSKGYNNKKFSVEQINASNKVYFIFPKKK